MPAPVFEPIRICKRCEQKGLSGCPACKWMPCDLCVEHGLRVKGDRIKK